MSIVITDPIRLDNVKCRFRDVIGVYELNDKIVFLHTVVGDVPREQITKDTVLPKYIIADFFTSDLKLHTQASIIYLEKRVLYITCCKCDLRDSSLVLNTMYYYYPSTDNALNRLIEVQNDSLCDIGESPEPIKRINSDQKTFTFGNYDIHMASPFMLECISNSTGITAWYLRLTAYLYTDIEEKDGMIYFGTAGKGGRFYGVSLQDGNVLFVYDTGGTDQYVWYENNVLVIDRTGEIVMLDSKTGAELNRFELRRVDSKRQKLRALPQMLIKDDNLYAVGCSNKDSHEFYALCIKL